MIFHNHALGDSMRDRHPVRAQRRYRPLLVVLSLLTLLVGLAFGASPARADDYSMDQTNIDATLDTSGGLTVTEVRAFDFDGDFHGVYWKIPKGENGTNGRTVSVQVLDAGIVEGGQARSFTESSAGANETYSITDYGSYLQIKLYSAQSDTTAHFYVSYYADGIATRWSDTGELYWKFVSDGWDVESQNVTCTIHLPVPSGESVVGGDNVRAKRLPRQPPRSPQDGRSRTWGSRFSSARDSQLYLLADVAEANRMEAPVPHRRVRTIVTTLNASVSQPVRRELDDDVLLADGPSVDNRPKCKKECRETPTGQSIHQKPHFELGRRGRNPVQ